MHLPSWPLIPGSDAAQEAIQKGGKNIHQVDSAYWNWVSDLQKRCENIYDFSVFLNQIAPKVLIDERLEHIKLFSPFSLFSALTIFSVLTTDNTQAEIYRLLGCTALTDLLSPMKCLLQGNCIDNGEVIKPSSSLWFDEKIQVTP